MPDARPREPAHALPGEDRRPRQRERERDEEEEEARREGAVRVHVQVAQEADEEGLAHGEPVDRERHEDDEEEERAHHVERPRPERHADRLRGEPDRERPLEQHRAGDRPAVPRVAPCRLEDPGGVAADRRGEHLADHVRDEVRADEPRKSVLDALRPEQPLPAPGHRPHGHDHDRERGDEVGQPCVRELVPGAVEVDLRDEVRDREPRHDERAEDAQRPSHARNPAWTRWSAAITSATSSSEWAGESGSESTSSPARSATGSGGWSGKRSRYHESRWTGRKWMLVPIRSSASARWYSSRVAPARSASMRTT